MCYSDVDGDGNIDGYRECVIVSAMVTRIVTVPVMVLECDGERAQSGHTNCHGPQHVSTPLVRLRVRQLCSSYIHGTPSNCSNGRFPEQFWSTTPDLTRMIPYVTFVYSR